MRDFNKNFYSHNRSLRTSTPIVEADEENTEKGPDLQDNDSRGKKQKRVEGRRKRLEGNFMSNDDSEFKLRPFLKVLGTLRDQIIAERINVYNATKTKAIGSKYASTVLTSLDTLLKKAVTLLNFAKSEDDKQNGTLEVDSDQDTIDSLINQYNDLENGYKKAAMDWKDAKQKELDEKPVDQDNEEIAKFISDANKFFGEAKTLLINSIASFTGSTGGSTDVKSGQDNKTETKSEIKDFKLKKSDSKGKIDENIKKIQELYLEIFKGTKVENTDVYKKASKYKADGKWGPTTSLMIDQVKLGVKSLPNFKDKDLGGKDEINQNLLAGLEELKKGKSKSNESVDTQKFLKTFESFMKEQKGINEGDTDLDAALAAMTKYIAPKVEQKKVEVKKADTIEALVKNKPELKKAITTETVEDMMKKAKDEAKKELKLEDLAEDLKKISGVEIVDGFDSSKGYKFDPKNPTKGYLAKCQGMRFFANGICIITYSGEVGYYNAETGYYAGKTGWREKISDLIKYQGVPLKYRSLTKKLFIAGQSPAFFLQDFTDMTKYPTSTVKTMLKAAKWYGDEKNVDIFDLIRDASKEHEEVKEFYEKNKEAFKELA